MALAVTVGVCAVLFSFSSQNIMGDRIEKFKEKNTAFAYGQIQFGNTTTLEKVESALNKNQYIEKYYFQYAIPESSISIGDKEVKIIPKQFGSIAEEIMNIGVMPKDGEKGEIAISPSVAKQLTDDLKSLIGKRIVFTCDKFSKELTVSGIFNGDFNNFYLNSDVEQELYSALELHENPASVSYMTKGFDEVLKIEKQLNDIDITPITASKQVKSLKTAFEKLKALFYVVSIFIMVIALFICIMLLMKTANIRAKEIGILMALGYKNEQIKKMLLIESVFMSLLSVIAFFAVIGIIIALSRTFSIALLIRPFQILSSVLATFIIVSIVTLYANSKLLKTDPAVVLRK